LVKLTFGETFSLFQLTTMKRILSVVLLSSATLISCSTKKENVATLKDFEFAIQASDNDGLKNCNEEILFWRNKELTNPSDTYLSKIGGAFAKRFAITGVIEDINTSDSLFKQVIKLDPNRTGAYQALAVNCMTRHEFRQARNYIEKALVIGDNKAASLFTLFDISMELGDIDGAKHILSQFENKNAFAYLIREAKVDDQEGKLDVAIEKMERAYERIKDDPSLFSWTLSNLGDMYGHEGRVDEAYQAYLSVLKKNPAHDFSLKGIAWIALSHDHNTTLAKHITSALLKRKEMPDMHLLLAKIAEQENNLLEKNTQLQLFTQKASEAKYGDMYNKYLALLEAEEFKNPSRTVEIATIEISNRPTPQSYDLLAWGYFQQGHVEKAIEVAQQHVEGKTFEPEATYHLGVIYEKIDEEKSRDFLKKALQSSFELGPSIAATIQKILE
jgi:tetratricopeptide (TPR) repeat protein